jgi:putative transposase
LQRLRRGYELEGFWALVDHRSARLSSPIGRADERVVAAMLTAIAEQTHQSTGTATRVRRRTQQILAAQHGAGRAADAAGADLLSAVRVAVGRQTHHRVG